MQESNQFSYMAIDIWKDLPSSFKRLKCVCIPKYIKTLPPVTNKKRNQFFHLANLVYKLVSHLILII